MADATTGVLSKGLEDDEAASSLANPEEWEDWEGKMVTYSLVIGVGLLVVLGAIINFTIL